MKREALREYVDRLGRTRAARRFNISEKTLSRWLSKGVPAKRIAETKEILRRYERGRKARTNAERHKAFREGGWRDEMSLPPQQKRGESLTEAELIPKRDPRYDEKLRRHREKLVEHKGWTESESTNWVYYLSPFQPLAMDLQTYLTNQEQIAEKALQLWREMDPSGPPKRTSMWFQLELARYYPLNPKYQGRPDLMAKAGHWVSIGRISTKSVATENGVADLPYAAVGRTNKINRDTDRVRDIGSILDDAESRNFWVLGFFVQVGLHREPLGLDELVHGEKRPPDPRKRKGQKS